MVLLISSSFRTRLSFVWKPELTAFLIGDRTHYFYVPDSLSVVHKVTPESIDSFLRNCNINRPLQLLGFLAAVGMAPIPGYVQVMTRAILDPERWEANVWMSTGETDLRQMPVEIRIAGS